METFIDHTVCHVPNCWEPRTRRVRYTCDECGSHARFEVPTGHSMHDPWLSSADMRKLYERCREQMEKKMAHALNNPLFDGLIVNVEA